MVEVTEARITQTDIVAAEAQAGKHYQTAYDYEMDLRQSYATHREAAAKAERDRLLPAIRLAQEALADRACHGGPEAPCLRTEMQCKADCGKKDADAYAALADALESKP